MNNKTKKAIKEEIEVVRKEYPKKDAKSVLYLAIRHVIRRENPEVSGIERYNLQKELFNEMEEDNMKTLRFDQIEGKLFSIVGIRHYTGVNELMKDNNGIIVVENNNIVLKTNSGEIVGSMLSSDTKMNELVELGVPKSALTQQKTFKIKNISKNVFDNVKVIVQQYIHNECVIVKIKENKGDEKMVEIPKDIKTITLEKAVKGEVNMMALNMSLDSLNESFEKAIKEYTLDMAKAINKVDEGSDSISLILQGFRELDDIIAKRYLNDEISGGEFDHVRAWITIQGYFFYSHNIEKIEMKEFFTSDSILASEKFLKEEEEKSSSFNDEDDIDEQELCTISDKKEKCTQCDYCITSGSTDCVQGYTEQEQCDMCRMCLN